jgi:hypothetical protein
MRVFLRTRKRGLYYRGDGQFSPELGEAREFPSVAAAAARALSDKLPDAEIAVRCDHLAQEVGLPVLAEWCVLGEFAGRDGAGAGTSEVREAA